jgi:hypothetical protein
VPAAPTLASPANGATGQSTSPTLTWNASSGATSYHLQVSASSTFSTLFYDNASLTSTSAVVSGLAYSSTYYWRVSAANIAGSSAYSGSWSLATAAAPPTVPAVPTLASPANGATGQSTSPTLTWNASSGATSYHLQVSASSTFSTLFYDNASLTSTSAVVNGLGYSTTYYWRVSAANGAGSSAYSGAWSLGTAAPAPTIPAVPTLASPANGATGQSTSPTLTWNASSGATSYHLQLSSSSTFSTLLYDNASLTSTSAVVSGLAYTTTYYWRVSAANSAGSSAYAGAWSFATVTAPLAGFAVTPTSLNFGTVKVGTPKVDSVTVSNPGVANLTVSSITSSSSKFVVSPTSGTVVPGGSMKVYITFTPTNKPTVTATITIAHNAAGSPGTVTVTGKGGTATAKFARTIASGGELPAAYAIAQNYPNPFNPTTTISFSLVDPSAVRLTIYNSIGQEVATLVDGQLDAGEQSVQWNATTGSGLQLPSGAYFYRIHATSLVNGEVFQSVKRMLLMK